jgi:TonB family protein
MIITGGSTQYHSDASAFVLTCVMMALFLATVRSQLDLRPVAQPDPAFELSMQVEEAPRPAPPTPPPPVPRKMLSRPMLRVAAQPVDPVPLVSQVAPSEAMLAVTDPAPASPPSAVSDPDLEAQYAAELRVNIDRRTAPPDSLQYRLHHPSGEVRVGFIVTRAGESKGVGVLHSSGSQLLDEAALNIVASGHYAPMPAKAFPGEEQHTFVVTIEFRPPSR